MRNGPREAGQDEFEEESSTHCPLEWVWLNTAWPSQPVTSHACVLHRDSLLAMSIRWGGEEGHMHPFVSSASLPRLSVVQTSLL